MNFLPNLVANTARSAPSSAWIGVSAMHGLRGVGSDHALEHLLK